MSSKRKAEEGGGEADGPDDRVMRCVVGCIGYERAPS